MSYQSPAGIPGTLGCGPGCSCGPCLASRGAPARLGIAPPALPRVTHVDFVTAGTTHPDNCCRLCPINLGVGRTIGAPPRVTPSNGVEMRFTLAGHRAGIDYDITRTRRDSVWERRGAVWTMLDSHPMGTGDDPRPDDDECKVPRGGRLFVIDAPGYPWTPLPQPDGTQWGTFNPAVSSHADALDVVIRFSFAEWVIARDRGAGIPWTRISPAPFIFWHSITWLTRNALRQWVLDFGRSRIARGSLPAATIRSAPVP